jgi:hypothetical protein
MLALFFKVGGVIAFTWFAWVFAVVIITVFGFPAGFMIGGYTIGYPFLAAVVMFYLTCKLSVS